MQTLEEFDREMSKKRRDLEAAWSVTEDFVPVPYLVVTHSDHFAVLYKVKNLKQAVELAAQFPRKMPYAHAKGEYCRVQPEPLLAGDRKAGNWEYYHETADGTPTIYISSGEGFRNVRMHFWVMSKNRICQIRIEMDVFPHKWMAYCVFHKYDNVRRTPVRKEYPIVPGATVIGWGTGSENAINAQIVWPDDASFETALATLPEFQENRDGA